MEAPALPGGEHMVDGVAKGVPPVALLKRVEKQETLCAQHRFVFALRSDGALRNHTQGAPDGLGTRGWAFDGFLSEGGGKGRQRRERRLLLVEARVLAVT